MLILIFNVALIIIINKYIPEEGGNRVIWLNYDLIAVNNKCWNLTTFRSVAVKIVKAKDLPIISFGYLFLSTNETAHLEIPAF